MSSSDIEIEIDNKKVLTQPNKMVIQVADELGIYIPRFCYHKHLSVAANCRMCLVEVEKSPKALPACATPVTPGMKVFTRSSKALAAQRAVMEFLLINHPLDCPVCDQGGECELQDLSLGYGDAESYYVEGKRAVKDEDLGPLISTEMTRCIHCTRCVRFGEEIAGMRELGLTGRGENTQIGTYIGSFMRSEVSGNVIDLCPVGALTSKPFRFRARAWELQQHKTIAPHDCLGSHLFAHTRNGKVMRVVPCENNEINQVWLSDRDRYSYEGLYHPNRLTKPLIRENGILKETTWQIALEKATKGIQQVIDNHGSDQLAALASPSSTLEEFYLLQKLVRALGSNNLDHRLHQIDFDDEDNMPLFPRLTISLEELENCDVIVLIGSNIQKEQPLISLRLRKAFLKGSRIISINMMDYSFPFTVAAKKIIAPHYFPSALEEVLHSLKQSESKDTLASLIKSGKKVAFLVGALATNHPKASIIRELTRQLMELSKGEGGILTEGANTAGAWLAGMVPHRLPGGESTKKGFSVKELIRNPRKGYLFLNVDFELDCAHPEELVPLSGSGFLVALSCFNNPTLNAYANVILPISPFTETSGTFVNAFGSWQSFKGVAAPYGHSKPGWKVLRALGSFLKCEGFDYVNSEEVKNELKEKLSAYSFSHRPYVLSKQSEKINSTLSRVGEIPLYATDALTRHAPSLQKAQKIIAGSMDQLHIHSLMAEQLNLTESEWVRVVQGKHHARLSVVINNAVPMEAVWIPAGVPETSVLPALFGEVEIQKWNQ